MQASVSFEPIIRSSSEIQIARPAYLVMALEDYENDKNSDAFLLALRDVAQAHGGLGSWPNRRI